MDPTQAIVAPWAQMGIVGSVVLALGVVVIMQWRKINEVTLAHLSEIRTCAAQTLDITMKKIESDNKLADALEGLERVIDATMKANR